MAIRDELLARCNRQFEESLERLEKLAGTVSPDQARWSPAPGKWSVAECIEHLNVSIDLYEKEMSRALPRARRTGLTGSGPWKRKTVPGSLLLRALAPTAKRSLPAPRIFKPAKARDLDFAAVCDHFRSGIAALQRLAEQADGLNLDRVRIPTPVGRMIRMTAAEAFRIQALHIPRHLAQAEGVTQAQGYPA